MAVTLRIIGLEQISAGLNRGIPKCLWLSESEGTDSVLAGLIDAEAVF
jgi:hypothetical protein